MLHTVEFHYTLLKCQNYRNGIDHSFQGIKTLVEGPGLVGRGGEEQEEDRCVYKKATLRTIVMTESLSILTVMMDTKTYTGDKITSTPMRTSKTQSVKKKKEEMIARGK